jgi:hypothetical protein
VFDANALASLKAKAKSDYVSNPTRYVSVSALIWMCLMRSSRKISSNLTVLLRSFGGREKENRGTLVGL